MDNNIIEIMSKVELLKYSKQRVVVAMSGGVDSSTVAALLHHQGHEVIGVTLQLYDHGMMLQKKGACCAGQDIYDASEAAEKIGIRHYVLNYESIFQQAVIDDFVSTYNKGQTPIPCVRCNQRVKFKDLLKAAKDLGADRMATGHYVRRVEDKEGVHLYRGYEHNKDQSYFLFATTKEQLEFLHFPIGGLSKIETRHLAKHFDLNISDKPDSQDICFVPNGDYASVIRKYSPESFESGHIIFKDGTPLGRHNGIIGFTVGQRKGIGIAADKPLYVIAISKDDNAVIVGYEEDLKTFTIKVKEMNWLKDAAVGDVIECSVKIRSGHMPIAAKVEVLADNYAQVMLYDGYKGVSPGQACVLYQEDRVLEGVWIDVK